MNKIAIIVLAFYAVVFIVSSAYLVVAIVEEPETKIEYRKYDRRW